MFLVVINSSIIAEKGSSFGLAMELLANKVRRSKILFFIVFFPFYKKYFNVDFKFKRYGFTLFYNRKSMH